MCGIAGRYRADGLVPDPGWRDRADRALVHRGPDGSGHYADRHCELVHRRLALLDLTSTGAQPLANEDHRIRVVFNGEIYNHRELRRELSSAGHCFRGTSDTEILVHLYEEEGETFVERLRGMFAFALYDCGERRLLLVRDRFGIKPLYVANHRGEWLFASEIKALYAARDFAPGLDRQACYDFLGLSYVPEPSTGLLGVSMLERGTCLRLDPSGAETRRFASVTATPEATRTLEEASRAVEDVLSRVLERQLVADVPVAALLSGGIDSSLVTAAAGRAGAADLRTFNVRFPDAQYDETGVALAVSQHCHTAHQTIDLDPADLAPDRCLELLRHFDQPFADTSLFPVYAICRAIRDRGIVCTLSGDGGDEAFGGYASFWRIEKLLRLADLPRGAQHVLGLIGRLSAPLTRDLGRQLAKAVHVAGELQGDTASLLSGLSNYLSPAQKHELVLPAAREGLRESSWRQPRREPAGTCDPEELSRRLTENYFGFGLPSDMLRKVDMMSMRTSLEVRVPMLDEELVEIGLSLPHRLKTDGRQGKLVLRRVAERWLPASVAAHPKHGFSIPLDRMATPAFHDLTADLLLASDARIRGVVNLAVVSPWLAAFRRAGDGRKGGRISRGGLYQRVVMLLALEVFLRSRSLTW